MKRNHPLIIIRNLYFILESVQLSNSIPVSVVNNEDTSNAFISNSARVLREVQEDPVAKDLENYVKTIPIAQFEGDYILVQFLDILNSVTTFRHTDPMRQEYAVYNTEYNAEKTQNQDIFVLLKYEDRIKVIKSKRSYVILRRCPKDSRFFYVSLIYLKDGSGIPGVKLVELGGKQFELEWDVWQHIGGKEYKAQMFGQMCCESSIFVSCHNDDTADFSKDNLNLPAKEKSEEMNFLAGKITLNDGDDADEVIDFFYDLDDDLKYSRFIGSTVDNLTRTISKRAGRRVSNSKGGGSQPGLVNQLANIFTQFVTAGMGLLKSFGGMFGGLGTDKASPQAVFDSLSFSHFDYFEERTNDNVFDQLSYSVKIPGSGGLGGFVNVDEDKEKPVPVSAFEYESGSSGRGFLDFLPEAMKDPMPDNVVDNVIQSVLVDNIDTFKHPGWKTLGVKPVDGITLKHENTPFVGFGACSHSEVTNTIVAQAKSPESLTEILQMATGTHCIKSKRAELSSLIKNGIITLSDHKSLQLADNIPFIQNEKLNAEKITRLSQAYELAVFSEVYFAELNSPTKDLHAPDGLQLSHSAFTLGKYVKSSLLSIRLSPFRLHCVKIRRNLVKTLKTFFLKLLEDKIILGECETCKIDQEINYNDSIYLISLTQFILRGMGPVRKGKDIHTTFEEFYNQNKHVFEGKVKSYYT